jgi:hypothetical protein
VSEPIAYATIALALVVAVWAGGLTVLNRRIDNAIFYTATVLEAAIVGQVVGGFVALAMTERSVDGITFSGYLLTVALIMPFGIAWGASDKSRWGAGVVMVSALVVVVLIVRLLQIWQGAGA